MCCLNANCQKPVRLGAGGMTQNVGLAGRACAPWDGRPLGAQG